MILFSVLIRDETQKPDEKFVMEYIFSQPVMNVRMKRNKYVILSHYFFVFTFEKLKLASWLCPQAVSNRKINLWIMCLTAFL